MAEEGKAESEAPPRRVIKRYSNRKLYDTKDSTYVTLLSIAEMVRNGEEVQIIDNATKEDKTDVTLALIISEELKAKPRAIPLATLKALIRNRSGRLISQLKDGPIGKFMPREGEEDQESAMHDAKEGPPKGLRATLEQWQSTIDERIRAVLPTFAAFKELQAEVERLKREVEELRGQLDEAQKTESSRE